MNDRLVIAKRAFQTLEDDCLAHPKVETGGILVGQRMGSDLVVPFVVPAGPRARRSASGFSPDSAWQQRYLDYLFDRFDVDFIGDYHKHPPTFDRPSSRDFSTARHIVTDPTWDKEEALFPIAIVRDRQVWVRCFLMQRQSDVFVEIPVAIVPDRDRLMRRVLLTRESGPKEVKTNGVALAHSARGPVQRGICRLIASLRTRAPHRGTSADSEQHLFPMFPL